MRRVLTVSCVCASAFSFVFSCSLCVRGYWTIDNWKYIWPHLSWVNFENARGKMIIEYCGNWNASSFPARFVHNSGHYTGPLADGWGPHLAPREAVSNVAGIKFAAFTNAHLGRFILVFFPDWFLVAITSISLGISVVSLQRTKRANSRRKLGLCPRCGYDVRASPARCSECGESLLKLRKNVGSRENPI
jgi:hypothetical protein